MRRYTKEEVENFEFFVKNNYSYRLWLDGLPSLTTSYKHFMQGGNHSGYEGIPLGIYDTPPQEDDKTSGKIRLINHISLNVNIAKHGNDTYRIVGFEVEPLSLQENENRLDQKRHWTELYHVEPAILEAGKDYNYSWEVKTKIVPYGHRLDHFNKIEKHINEVFHYQLIYTALVILALTFITWSSVTYVIKRDLASIKEIEATQMTYLKERGHSKIEDFMVKN